MNPWVERCLQASLLGACLSWAMPARAAAATPADCPPAAHAPTAEEATAAQQGARDRGFLWRVSKNGRASYLYGTIHIAQMAWMFPGPTVVQTLRASDVVALELDMTDSALMQRLQSGLPSKANEPGSHLPDDLAQRLRAQLLTACLPPEMLGRMAPEMLSATLVLMSVRREGLDASYGIDAALASLGRALKKTVLSLETPEMQLELLRSSSDADLRQGLEKALDELEHDRARPMLLRLARDWDEGRADELEHYRDWCDCANTARERDELKVMIDDRNVAMATRIAALHGQGKTVFAAVGSLHMFGPAGLPALMAKRGYRVERVEFKP